jgi:hypothetical protein
MQSLGTIGTGIDMVHCSPVIWFEVNVTPKKWFIVVSFKFNLYFEFFNVLTTTKEIFI